MTSSPPTTSPPPDAAHSGGDAPSRAVDLRLASLHLRTGSYALARAELETMAGNGTLDDDGLLDLAEVRWRTGDLPGAGEASAAFLTSGRESVLALVIAAEATAALGRPGEARRLAGRAMEAADGPLEPLFAGLPRGPIWPQDPADPAEPAGTFFADEGGRAATRPASGAVGAAGPGPVGIGDGGMAAVGPGPGLTGEALPASLWDSHLHGAHAHAALPAPALPDGPTMLDAARRALEAGAAGNAVVQLGIVLRVSPGLAPAVLEVAGSTPGAGFDLIRGDAYRLVGHEAEAQRAFASAAATLSNGTAAASAVTPGPESIAVVEPNGRADAAGPSGEAARVEAGGSAEPETS
jgi:hypothetical protein